VAISIDWGTKVITIPKADTTLVDSGPPEIRSYDVNTFRLALKALEDDEYGMDQPDTHIHSTEVTLAGITYARAVEITNGYTITFENGSYIVRLTGANHNIPDVLNLNSVQTVTQNSAGMVSGSSDLGVSKKMVYNRAVQSGDIITIYEDDGVTVWKQFDLSTGREEI
jgi:hypothetical protein